jgi:hypothetical protein
MPEATRGARAALFADGLTGGAAAVPAPDAPRDVNCRPARPPRRVSWMGPRFPVPDGNPGSPGLRPGWARVFRAAYAGMQ